MMERLEARGVALGRRAADRARDRLVDSMRDALPGVEAHAEGDGIVLSGRGLRARLMREPVLRWIGSLTR